MAITTASISPCLQVEPENTDEPGFLVTGRDSPVSADWRKDKPIPRLVARKLLSYDIIQKQNLPGQSLKGLLQVDEHQQE